MLVPEVKTTMTVKVSIAYAMGRYDRHLCRRRGGARRLHAPPGVVDLHDQPGNKEEHSVRHHQGRKAVVCGSTLSDGPIAPAPRPDVPIRQLTLFYSWSFPRQC